MANISFTQHRTIDDIKEEWEYLDKIAEEQSDCPYVSYSFYQTYTWHKFLYGHIKGKIIKRFLAELVYIVMKVDGKPTAIIPFMVTRSSGKVRFPSCWVAGILNASIPYPPRKISDKSIDALKEYMDRQFSGCHLSLADVPQCTPFAGIMRRLGGDYTERASYRVPLACFSTVDEYIASLSKNIYKNIRKSYNHLKTDGREMALKVYTRANLPDKRYLYRLWRMYFIRKLAWNGKSESVQSRCFACIKAMLEVMGGCATKSLKQLAESRLYVLEIDSLPAAFMIVYAHRRHLLMPRLAIDMNFSRYSPGIVMLLESVKLWINEGFVDFDMCRGDERYKTDMGGVNEPLCRIERVKNK